LERGLIHRDNEVSRAGKKSALGKRPGFRSLYRTIACLGAGGRFPEAVGPWTREGAGGGLKRTRQSQLDTFPPRGKKRMTRLAGGEIYKQT